MDLKSEYNQLLINQAILESNERQREYHLENLIPYNIEIEGIDYRDAPDLVDAFLIYAEHIDGQAFTDEELDYFNENCGDQVYEMVINSIF